MLNQWFHIIVSKYIIVKKIKKIITTNYFTTIWSIGKETLKRNISTCKRIKYFNRGEYLVIRVFTSMSTCKCM